MAQEDFPTPPPPEGGRPSSEPYDFTGISADEIIDVHRLAFGYSPDSYESFMSEPARETQLAERFELGFEKFCVECPAEATEVLAKLSASADRNERHTSIMYLDVLARGNVAAAMTMLAAILSDKQDPILDKWEMAIEAADKAYEEGDLSLEQITYLLGVYEANPFRPPRPDWYHYFG